MKKFAILISISLFFLAGCATSTPRAEAELQDYYAFREAIFEGMQLNDLMKVANREPHTVGQGIDNDMYVFQFLTSEGGLDRHYQRSMVIVDRQSGTVVDWEM